MAKEIKNTRIRLKDMEKAMWHPKDSIQPPDPSEDGVLVFTILGKQDGRADEEGNIDPMGFPAVSDVFDKKKNKIIFAEDREHAYAKSIRRGRQVRYYVRKDGNGNLYNPIGMYTEIKHSKMKRAGLEMWKFDEVERAIFVNYLKFLTTKNRAWLNTAQRELI